MRFGIDPNALIEQFAQASAKQGPDLRKAVQQTTLTALQSRELTLKHVKDVLGIVARAASAGVEKNAAGAGQVEGLLGQAVAGMDAALVQAVEANRRALQQLVDLGADLRESHTKKALSDIEKMESAMFTALGKAVSDAEQAVRATWGHVLEPFKLKGSATGASAADAVAQLAARAEKVSREGRAGARRTLRGPRQRRTDRHVGRAAAGQCAARRNPGLGADGQAYAEASQRGMRAPRRLTSRLVGTDIPPTGEFHA